MIPERIVSWLPYRADEPTESAHRIRTGSNRGSKVSRFESVPGLVFVCTESARIPDPDAGFTPDAEAQRQGESAQAFGCLHQRRFFRAGHPAILLRDHTYIDAETIATRREAPWRCAKNRRWCKRHRGLTWGWMGGGLGFLGAARLALRFRVRCKPGVILILLCLFSSPSSSAVEFEVAHVLYACACLLFRFLQLSVSCLCHRYSATNRRGGCTTADSIRSAGFVCMQISLNPTPSARN